VFNAPPARCAAWQSALELAALTNDREPSAWMFPTSTGTLIQAAALGKRFRLVLRKAALPFRLYDLRHSYASHLLAEGAPITTPPIGQGLHRNGDGSAM
jgi:integrase